MKNIKSRTTAWQPVPAHTERGNVKRKRQLHKRYRVENARLIKKEETDK